MIKLYQFNPAWGLPNPSPFCMKVETYLRMVGLPYEVVNGAMPVMCKHPEIVDSNFNEPGLVRPAHDAVIQWPAKKVRENRQYLELHSGLPRAALGSVGC